MADVTIRPSKNGPYIVEGAVDLYDTEGNKLTPNRPRIALRSGGSEEKRSGFYRVEALWVWFSSEVSHLSHSPHDVTAFTVVPTPDPHNNLTTLREVTHHANAKVTADNNPQQIAVGAHAAICAFAGIASK